MAGRLRWLDENPCWPGDIAVGLMGPIIGSIVGLMAGNLMLEDDSKWLEGLILAQQAGWTMRRAERRSVCGGNSNEALARPLAAKIGVNNLSMKKSSILVIRYLDYL